MFEIANIERLARELDVDLLAKVMFGFGPEIVMSPLVLPREILHPWIDEILAQCQTRVMRDMLEQLKKRPTFAEQFADTYAEGIRQGKSRVLKLESIRTAPTDMATILSARPAVAEWWNQIETN
jgi:hypothetical protein